MAAVRRDKRRERYSRNLEGLNVQGFFSPAGSPAQDYPADSESLATFLVSAPEGQIGLMDSSTNTVVPDGAALPAGTTFRIVQKQDSELKTSVELSDGSFSVMKTPHDGAVIQESIVGYNGSSGSLNISIVGGLQEFVASARETTPANQPFPVTEGRAIVRSGTPTDYQIANNIARDINQTYDFEGNADENFVRVDLISDAAAAGITDAIDLSLLEGSAVVQTSGDISGDFSAGDAIAISVTGVTGQSVFKVVDSSTTSITLDRAWPHPTETVTTANASPATTAGVVAGATIDAAEIGIRFRGHDELAVFEVSISEDLGDATLTNTTAWKQGSGEAWQVASMEDEAAVFQGWTTGNEAFVRDYGMPSLFVDDSSADQYVLYWITYQKSVIPSAAPPQNQTLHQGYALIAAISGSDLETDLDAIFGT